MVVKHSFTVFAMLVLFLLIHFLNISLSLAVKPSFDASQSERNRWKLHEICYRSEGGLQAHHDAPQGRTAALEDGRGNPRFDLGSCQADYCLQDLLRVAGGDEGLIAEMRSSVARNSVMYQMANEELARDNNKRKTDEIDAVVDETRYKRLKEMVSDSRELLENMRESIDLMRERLELKRGESTEEEKQIMMRSKERSEILVFEDTRHLKEKEHREQELEFHKKLNESKLMFEKELLQIRNACPVDVPAAAVDPNKPKVYTFPELLARDGGVEVITIQNVAAALDGNMKKFGLKKEQWKAVLCKAGVAAATKLNVRAKVLENQLAVNAYWPNDRAAIKSLVEDEIRNFKAGPSSALVQPPIHLSLRVHVEPPPHEPANRALVD